MRDRSVVQWVSAGCAGECKQHQKDYSRQSLDGYGMPVVHHHEENRDGHQREEHRSQQSEGDHAGHRRPQAGAGEDHGNDAHRGSRRGEENGPQPALSGLQRGLLQFHAALHPFVNVIDQDDGISDH